MSFWRRLIGLDPARRDGVVVADVDPMGEVRRILDDNWKWTLNPTAFDVLRGGELAFESLKIHRPKGNPLADKERRQLHHGLHLDDYRPRDHEHPVQRLTFERAYPPLPKSTPVGFMHRMPDTSWVDYRNRSPIFGALDRGGPFMLPPMRDALADLTEHLAMVRGNLADQGLVAVEVSVQHEPTPSHFDGANQGWNFAVHVVAVPAQVLLDEAERFERLKQDRARKAAEAEDRLTGA